MGPRARVLISSEGNHADRRATLESFRKRAFPVLINVGIYSEGVDVPGINSVFIARPTKSRILLQQMVGRAMRGLNVGGTEVCEIVLFSTAVRDLLNDGVLHATYASAGVLCLPTGAGKTRTAVAFILREAISTHRERRRIAQQVRTCCHWCRFLLLRRRCKDRLA